MKKLLHKGRLFVRRVWLMIDSLIKIYRRGGYATFNISYISNGSLLRGKRVLVTGGSSGIGFCIAQKCIQQGAKVVITGRDASKLEAAAQRINHPFCKTLVWDVGRTADIEKGVKESVSLLGGRVDILVNNAGIVNGVDFPDVPEEMWDQIYAVNSKGVFFVTQAICKLWLREGSAETRKVLNISSQGGFVGATYPYRMTKWDIVGLTQGLGVKLAPHGIIVNGIAPGIVATAMQPSILTEQANIFHHLNPLQRYALPQEIAELALFLLTDLSNFIVGQTIVCDGGFSLK